MPTTVWNPPLRLPLRHGPSDGMSEFMPSVTQQKCVECQVCQALDMPQRTDAKGPCYHGTHVLVRDGKQDWETGRKQANGRVNREL